MLEDIFRDVRNGSEKDIRQFFKGAFEELDMDAKYQNDDGLSYLHFAAQYNENTEIAKILISMGADVNTCDNVASFTPLLIAVIYDNFDVAEILVNGGADVNMKDSEGNTPLHYVSLHGNINFAKVLLSKGSDINAKNNDGDTPLYKTALKGNIDFAKLLLSKGADVNVKNNAGGTSLHVVAFEGNINFAKVLISYGADVNTKSNINAKGESYTPIDMAKQRGNTEMIQYLSSIPKTEENLDQDFIEVLQKIMAKHGIGPILDADKCNAFIGDYAKKDYNKERQLLIKAVEAGVSKVIFSSAFDKSNLSNCVKQQHSKLQGEFNFDPTESSYVVNILTQILLGVSFKLT